MTASGTEQNDDVFVEKLDTNGNVLWVRQMGGEGPDQAYALASDTEGNSYVTGMFMPGGAVFGPFILTPLGGGDAFVEKLDTNGNVKWAERMGSTSSQGDFGQAIGVAADGTPYAAGWFSGSGAFGPISLPGFGGEDVYVVRLGACGTGFAEDRRYGSLLFPPHCTQDTLGVTQGLYDSRTRSLYRGPRDAFFLAAAGVQFTPLIADDRLDVNGVSAGLGPYADQPGRPPYLTEQPIEANLIPSSIADVTNSIPPGTSTVSFELFDTQGTIYGNTAIYLVQDCGIWLSGKSPSSINFVTHNDPASPEFDVRYGLLSQLRADHGFAQIQCMEHFYESPGVVTLPTPAPGEGYYFLSRGLSACVPLEYGDAHAVPDPRDALEGLSVCPCANCF
jgi:hypothetical protein